MSVERTMELVQPHVSLPTAVLVLVHFRQAELLRGLPFEVELDHHGRLVPFHPPLMSRFDHDELRRLELGCTSIPLANSDRPARDKPHMRMHAQVGPADLLHLLGPAKAGRISHTLYAPIARARHINGD